MLTGSGICNTVPNLDNVDISIAPGRLTGIIGPNGAGKTTLLKFLAGLGRADQGRVELDGQSLESLPSGKRARRIAYLAQHAFVHWPLSVHQLVDLGRFPHRLDGPGKVGSGDEIVLQVMDRVGVANLAERSFNSLSGGERARVLLARALAVEADYLLIDEPIAALDLKFQIGIMELLKAQAGEQRGVCVILHDLNLAAAWCESLYLLDCGRFAAHGPPDSVLTHRALKDTFGIQADIRRVDGKLDIYPLSGIRSGKAGKTG